MNNTQRVAAAHAAAIEGLWLDPEQVAGVPSRIRRNDFVGDFSAWTCSCGEAKAQHTAIFPTEDTFWCEANVPVCAVCAQALARAMGAVKAGV